MCSRLVAALFLILGSVHADRVPVMMWSNEESVIFPPVLAGHSVSTADFEKDYIEQFGSANKNLVVFVQNKLSIADISHYANIYGYEDEEDSTFQNVKALMTELTSSHLPNVISPMSVFENVKNKNKVRTLQAPYDLEELVTSTEGLGLLLVKLNDIDTAQYQKSLQDNDKIIGDVIKQLEAHGVKYTALYTALTSSNKVSAQDFIVVKSASGRQLLASDDTSDSSNTTGKPFPLNDGSLLLYLGGLSISINSSTSSKEAQPLDLQKLKLDQEASECSGGNQTNDNNNDNNNSSSCVMNLSYDSNEPVEGLNLTFKFSQSTGMDSGYWYISSLEITYVNQSGADPVKVDMSVDSIGSWSPLGFSFSCNAPAGVGPKNKTQKAGGPYLFFKQIQVQAYGKLVNGGFGYYNDCEAFFSMGIWMALICLAVMIGILVFGLYMLCQITTMDRFDDPKGKTIIVAAATD